jgi:hypothetical protein
MRVAPAAGRRSAAGPAASGIDADDPFRVSPEDKQLLLESIAQADRGELIDAAEDARAPSDHKFTLAKGETRILRGASNTSARPESSFL